MIFEEFQRTCQTAVKTRRSATVQPRKDFVSAPFIAFHAVSVGRVPFLPPESEGQGR